MSVAGTYEDLQEVVVLTELPRLTKAIDNLNANVTRLFTVVEARTSRLEDAAERNDGGIQRMADTHVAIEAELKHLNANVSRITQVVLRSSGQNPEVPWNQEEDDAKPVQRRVKDARPVNEEADLAALFLATIRLADRP